MSSLLLALALWGVLSVVVVAGLCLVLQGRSAFNRAPHDAGLDREHPSRAGAHAIV